MLADPLQAITDALQLSAKSGVCNACAYAHVMYGLFVQHQMPTDNVLAAILETEPRPPDREGSVAGAEETGPSERDSTPAASATPAPPGAEEEIAGMDVDEDTAPGVDQPTDDTHPASLMPPGLSKEPPPEASRRVAKAAQTRSTDATTPASGTETPAGGTETEARWNGNRGQWFGRGGSRVGIGSRGRGKGRPGVGPSEPAVADRAGRPRRTPSVALEVTRRAGRGRVWRTTNRSFHG